MTASAIQYDLFGEVEAAQRAAETAAHAAVASARAFLTQTPWPGLVSWWLHPEAIESRLHHGEVKASYRRGPGDDPGWAWATWRDGLRFEAGGTWQGWDHRPRWCIPWVQLSAVRDAHPAITAQLRILADGRGHPNTVGWRWWTDPFVLHPDGWHESYLESEQDPDWYDGCERPESAYADRLKAWHLALDVMRRAELAVTETW